MRDSSLDEKVRASSPKLSSSPHGEKAVDVASNSDSNGKANDDESKDSDAKKPKAGIRDYAVCLRRLNEFATM